MFPHSEFVRRYVPSAPVGVIGIQDNFSSIGIHLTSGLPCFVRGSPSCFRPSGQTWMAVGPSLAVVMGRVPKLSCPLNCGYNKPFDSFPLLPHPEFSDLRSSRVPLPFFQLPCL